MNLSICCIVLLMLTLLFTFVESSTFVTVDVYTDLYQRTIFRMNPSTRANLPLLSDQKFMEYLTHDNGIQSKRMISTQADSAVLDGKLDAQLITQRNSDEKWEELMISGPLIINYLGNLMVIASQQDFAFVSPSPNYVYQYIHYPNSFRATLVQLSGELYEVLLAAHTGMDRIQTFTSQIPTHINTTLKLVTRASPNMIKSLLPNTLASIVRISDMCVGVANDTVNKFAQSQNLIEEIIRVSTNALSPNASLINELQQQISNGKNEVDLLTANVTSIKEFYQEKREALEKARQEYWEASHAIPGRRKRRGLFGNIIGGAWNVITAPITAIGCILGKCNDNGGPGQPSPPVVDNSAFENAMAKATQKLEVLKQAEAEHDKWFEKQLGDQYKLAALIQQLASLELDKIEAGKIIDILSEAFKEIQNIKKQWSEVRRFFLSVSLEADSTKELIGSRFVNVIESTLAIDGTLSVEDREFFVELLVIAAEDIDQNAALLYIMAKTYYDVSSAHMMHQIAGIGHLLILYDAASRQKALRALENDAMLTATKITNMVQERQLAYKLRLNARQAQLQVYLDNNMKQILEANIS